MKNCAKLMKISEIPSYKGFCFFVKTFELQIKSVYLPPQYLRFKDLLINVLIGYLYEKKANTDGRTT